MLYLLTFFNCVCVLGVAAILLAGRLEPILLTGRLDTGELSLENIFILTYNNYYFFLDPWKFRRDGYLRVTWLEYRYLGVLKFSWQFKLLN